MSGNRVLPCDVLICYHRARSSDGTRLTRSLLEDVQMDLSQGAHDKQRGKNPSNREVSGSTLLTICGREVQLQLHKDIVAYIPQTIRSPLRR